MGDGIVKGFKPEGRFGGALFFFLVHPSVNVDSIFLFSLLSLTWNLILFVTLEEMKHEPSRRILLH